MPRVPVPLAIGSYQKAPTDNTNHRLVNWYAAAAPTGGKKQITLNGSAGLKQAFLAGDGPIRGMRVMGSFLYVVSGNRVFRIRADGQTFDLGAIPSAGPVIMDDNGTQLAIVTKQGAGIIVTETSVIEITDPDFLKASSVAYLDGYFCFSRLDSGEFFISNQLDGLNYDSLEFASAESDPDNLVRVLEDHQELWMFGEDSTEIWYNSGQVDFPFERLGGAVLEIGCSARFSPIKVDNTVYWIGNDPSGIKAVFRAQGYQPVRVSNAAVEASIGASPHVSDTQSMIWSEDGHVMIGFKAADFMWVYDHTTGEWHERASRDSKTWRVNCTASFAGRVLAGDSESGKIFEIDTQTYDEDGTPLIAEAQLPYVHAERREFTVSCFEAEFETGLGSPGDTPVAGLSFSKDGGRTWSAERHLPLGPTGSYRQRIRARQIGRASDLLSRVRISDPVKRHFIAAYLETNVGR